MTRQTLNTTANLFGLCFLLCAALQIIALLMVIGMHDFAYRVHSYFFNISDSQFDLAVYCILGLMKTLGLTLFLVPWAALKIMARLAGDSP